MIKATGAQNPFTSTISISTNYSSNTNIETVDSVTE